jgi:hypothetical protein
MLELRGIQEYFTGRQGCTVNTSSAVDLVWWRRVRFVVAQTANNIPRRDLTDAIESCIADMLELLVFVEYSKDDKAIQ